VELQGFEPWSKQVAKKFSTCLSFNLLSEILQAKGEPIKNLILLIFAQTPRPYLCYLNFFDASYRTPLRKVFCEAESYLIYMTKLLTDIRYCCRLMGMRISFYEPYTQRSACLLFHYPCCQIQISPIFINYICRFA